MRALIAFVVIALLASVHAPIVQARQAWYQLYTQAADHVAKEEWGLAFKKLVASKEAAARAGIEPGPRAGNRNQPFFPDYYLGIVYLRVKRAKEAVDAFEAARQQGLTPAMRGFENFDDLAARAQADVRGVDERRNTAQKVEQAPPPEAKPADSDSAPIIPGPTRRERFDRLMTAVDQALKRRAYSEALGYARQAMSLDVDNGRAEARIAEIHGVRLSEQIEAALHDGDTERARTGVSELASAAPGHPRLADLRTRIDDLDRASLMARTERAAMRAFFGGSYEMALKIILEAERRAGQLTPRGYLYKATSLAALALHAKAPDRGRLEEARRQYALAAPNRRQFARDLQYISPKIIKELGGS